MENPKSNCQFNQLNLVRVNDNNIHPILVLSSRQLTLEEHEVLLLGLKFAPTPRRVPDSLEYFDRYHEQCRRTYNKLTHVRADRPLPKLIEEHLVVIKDKLSHLAVIGKKDNKAQTHEQWNNLSTKHQQAIRRLRLDKSLTIKPADKGSCIVVMDTKDYLSEGLKELADKSTYMELESDPTAEITDASNAILDKYHGIGMINKYTRDKYFTSIDDVRTQRMYFLRKVHKSPHQLRPIVSCCSGPTQKLSQLTNNLLRDYLHSVPSLIVSSTQVIKVIESLTVPIDSRKQLLLATLDVKALYPSIPQALGVNFALQQALPTDPPTSTSHPLKNMLKEMLLHVIRHNTFEFAKKNFRQIKGVAMGTPVATTLANLFMGKVEFDALNAWPGTQPIVWLRYIDDILLLLEDTDDCLTELLAHLNDRVSSIKFTKESSTQSIDFLDLTIFKGPRFESQGILDTRPTSTDLLWPEEK